MSSGEEANHFELAYGDTRVRYDTTSLTGSPQFSYSSPHGDKTFEGKEIRTEHTALGTQVTGVLKQVPDGDTLTVTLIVPSVRLDGSGPEPVSTFLVITTNRETIAGPPVGADQLYEVVSLDGTAASVQS